MPAIDLSILNQRQTPAFYADVFANRPAAGFVGRIFVSTNTFAFYRDNGTSWDLIGGPGTGTVTGTGANGQVTFWNGASTITGSNDLFWDATNGHLGVNTNVPGTALDVHHDQPTVAILNQTVATNDTRIGFQNNGVGLWRIGAFYNAGANDFGIYDAVAAIQPVTVKKTTGQVLIGTSTVGSGRLVVASATSDNGIQVVGANAPSLRIDSAESGPTKRIGLGISTGVNNFIQGSVDRDMCIFNGSTTASPILFGIYDTTNVQEAARISAARNFLVNRTTDNGRRLQISGTGYIDNTFVFDGFNTSQYIQFYNSGVDRAHLYWNEGINSLTFGTYVAGGSIKFETGINVTALTINSSQNATFVGSVSSTIVTAGSFLSNAANGASGQEAIRINNDNGYIGFFNSLNTIRSGYLQGNTTDLTLTTSLSTPLIFGTANVEKSRISPVGNFLIGTTTDNGQKLQVNGTMAGANTFINGAWYHKAFFKGNVTTSFVTIGVSTVFVALVYVYWSDNISGARDFALLSINFFPSSVVVISSTNNGGNGVTFQMNGSNLEAKTTLGTVTMTSTWLQTD